MDFIQTRGWEVERAARFAAASSRDPEPILKRFIRYHSDDPAWTADTERQVRELFARVYGEYRQPSHRHLSAWQSLVDYKMGKAPRPRFISNVDDVLDSIEVIRL